MWMLTRACLNHAMDWRSFTEIHSDITAQRYCSMPILHIYITDNVKKNGRKSKGGGHMVFVHHEGGSYDFKTIARGGHILF